MQRQKKAITGQNKAHRKANIYGYVPVEKHSQRKEHPDTFVVSIRLPYLHHDKYKQLSAEGRNSLRIAIGDFLSSTDELM
jgi:hypothetical protein